MGVFAIRRAVLIASLALLTGCAQHAASNKELTELRAELRALRQSNAQLEQRLERLEDHQKVVSARHKPPASEQPWDGGKVPALTVVKLKPRHSAPPPLQTQTEVQEPAGEVVELLLDGSSEPAEPAQPPGVDPAVAEAAFEDAMSGLRTGNVAGAVLKLQAFAEEHPRHARSDNALYFSGVGLMSLDDHEGAARAFERVLKEYPAGDARLESMLKLADCRVKLNQKDDARTIYARLISTYPGTPAATTAQERLSALTQ